MKVHQWLLMAMVLLAAPALRAAPEFDVENISTRLEEGVFVTDADVAFRLSDKARDALLHGVLLTFVVEVGVRARDAWFWQDDVARREARYTLKFRPLSDLYEVVDETTGARQSFATGAAALRTLGEIRAVELVERDRLQAGQAYTARLRAYLDIEALPLPMRPLAYLSPAWRLSTGTIEWLLEP
ncbi:MAG: DUF4390 domain-containing protein [Pseudomonadota bacterium]